MTHTASHTASGPGKPPDAKAYLLLTPLVLWLLLLVVLPTLTIVIFSFCRRGPLGSVVYEFTLDNFRQLVDRPGITAVLRSAVGGLVAAGLAWAARRRLDFWAIVSGLSASWVVANGMTLTFAADIDLAAPVWRQVAGGAMLLVVEAAGLLRLGVLPDAAALPWLKIAVVSINYALASTGICVLVGYPVAYFIARSPARWRGLLLLGVMVPFWTSFLIRTYAWFTILREGGLLDTLAIKLGLNPPDASLGLYPSTTGVIIGLIYTYLPFMILPIYTSIERLEPALIEAALDLGATPSRAFARVILPLTRPGIVAGVVLTFVPAVGMFAVNDILGGRREMLLGNLIERQFITALDKPFGSAIGMLLVVMFVVTYAMTGAGKSEIRNQKSE